MTTNNETATQPATAAKPATPVKRQIVSFRFFRVAPEWRRQPAEQRRKQAADLEAVINRHKQHLMINTYSLIGMKADVDFLIWRVGPDLETVQAMSTDAAASSMGGYLSTSYSFLSMTKRSTYVDKFDPTHQDRRLFITPAQSKYLFVYPFVKTRAWYRLPMTERQRMMDEHIRIGMKYPSVRLHTTYSFGLDDQEFIVAFETDKADDFLDLVQELRESEGSVYTLRDTPIFTCVLKPFGQMLRELGG